MDNQELRRAFIQCGLSHILGDDTPDGFQRILRHVSEVDELLVERRLGVQIPVADAIIGDTERFRPFFEAFAQPMTTPIRAMIYCVVNGAQVKRISFEYRFKTSAVLEVDIECDNGKVETFVSHDLWDAAALRHFTLLKVGNAPVVDGYYAFRQRSQRDQVSE